MKKIILFIGIILLLTNCTSSDMTINTKNRFQEISTRKGITKTVVVGKVEFSNPQLKTTEKLFNNSLDMIFQTELRSNNFKVYERAELPTIMDEYAFSNTLGNKPLNRNFTVSEYTMFLKIINIGVNDSGIIIPIVFNKLEHQIEISVELKAVNNSTGEIQNASGTGIVSFNTWNALILIGDINKSYNIPLENALKMAIRDSLTKISF